MAVKDQVDDADVLERAKDSPALAAALELLRPRNWWGTGVKPTVLIEISKHEGIPLVWVPCMSIVRDLAKCPDAPARNALLLNVEDEIVDDCASALSECTDAWLNDTAPLANAALTAYKEGHREAAMALAVSVCEPLAMWASQPRVSGFWSREDKALKLTLLKKIEQSRYRRARFELDTNGRYGPELTVHQQALIAPIPTFFTAWWPEGGKPVPVNLSRHAVAHHATVQHFSRENCLRAVMLVNSLLRQQQDWSEEVRYHDSLGDG